MKNKAEDDEDPISVYTQLPGIHRTFKVKTDAASRGKVYLEGHDISHLVRGYSISAQVHDAVTVTIELIGLEIG